MLGLLDGKSLAEVALILGVECQGRVLGVSREEYLITTACHHHRHTTLLTLGQDIELRTALHILAAHLGMAAVRDSKLIIEATEERQLGLVYPMFEDTKHLLLQRILRYAIVVIQSRLCSPADVERGGHVMACPLEDLLHLIPVAHLLEVQMLHWSSRNDEAIVPVVAHLLEVGIERLHVFQGRILRDMVLHLHEAQFDLQRRVGEQTHEVGLSSDLDGHEVEHGNAQRRCILRCCTRGIHHEDILLLQQFYSWQPIG